MQRSLRVLIVEDSEQDAAMLLREMGKGGYEPDALRVDTAAAVAEALDRGGWELMLLDYSLPQCDALDVLAMVMQRRLDLPVIVVSGATGEERVVGAMHAGARDYITKDSLYRLNPAIERELREAEIRRERKRAELAVRESEERFRELADNVEVVFWLVDCAEQRMLYISPAYEKLWDCSAAPLLDSLDTFLDTVHPEDYGRIESCIEDKGWVDFNEEYRIQRPDGSVRHLCTRSFPISDVHGRLYRVAGLTSDVTERKRLEAEGKTMSRALEQSADAVLITDRDGVIIYVNPAFEDITGYGREDVLRQRPAILKSGLQDDAFYRNMWQALLNGLPYTDIFINRRKDGELYYEEKTISPVRDEYGHISHFVSTGKDITQRLRAQQRLHRIIHYDALTGLANRILFVDRLRQAVLQARRLGTMVAVLRIGVDLADLFGEGKGRDLEEKLLPLVANGFKRSVRENDTVARLDRNEFSILYKDVRSQEDVEDIVQRILGAFAAPIKAEGCELFISPNIGISLFPHDSDDVDELLENADIAMQHAREHGHSSYRFFTCEMKPHAGSRLSS